VQALGPAQEPGPERVQGLEKERVPGKAQAQAQAQAQGKEREQAPPVQELVKELVPEKGPEHLRHRRQLSYRRCRRRSHPRWRRRLPALSIDARAPYSSCSSTKVSPTIGPITRFPSFN